MGNIQMQLYEGVAAYVRASEDPKDQHVTSNQVFQVIGGLDLGKPSESYLTTQDSECERLAFLFLTVRDEPAVVCCGCGRRFPLPTHPATVEEESCHWHQKGGVWPTKNTPLS